MTDEHRDQLISAAFDGEPVDLGLLQDALSTGDGHETLVSLLLLRAAVAADATLPITGLRPEQTPEAAVPGGLFRMLSLPRVAAAACAAALVVASFFAGARWSANDSAVPLTPRTTHARPVPAAAPGLRPPAGDDAPPAVNRVLRFTPGVDWHPAS